MGRSKIEKFRELQDFNNVLQPKFEEVFRKDYYLKGKWHSDIFKNTNSIVLEIGCGRGEYTLFLSKKYKNKNYIGIDIKGARIWKGAKNASEEDLPNVLFLRTLVENLPSIFAPDEIDVIWLTFPDPQMKKTKKRLISANFLRKYQRFLKNCGHIHLKTDSRFLSNYTETLLRENNIQPVYMVKNISDKNCDYLDDVKAVETHYEKQFTERGIPINYIQFQLPQKKLIEPEIDIELDSWKSYGR